MPEFTIDIKTFAGAVESTITNPTGLSWTYQIGANGPGKVEWSMAESDAVVLGLDGVTTMPYKRDFQLNMDGFPLMGGFIDSVNMPLKRDELHFVGVDWLKWLNQDWRSYYSPGPMDYADDIDTVIALDDPDEFHLMFQAGATVQNWVEAILAVVSENAGEQVILSPVYSGDAFSQELTGYWSRSSTTSVISLLQEIGAMGDPYGFDFWVEWNKELNLIGPRKTDPLSVFPIATMTQDSGEFLGEEFDESPIVDGNWTNNGPLGTDIFFRDGHGNAMRYYRKPNHQPSVDQFRRWGAHATIGSSGDPVSFGTQADAEFKAAAASYRMMFPQRELTLTVKPELFTFGRVLLDPIAVDYQKFPGSFRRINASFWITSQTYREAETGSDDWLCDLTLDQIYVPI